MVEPGELPMESIYLPRYEPWENQTHDLWMFAGRWADLDVLRRFGRLQGLLDDDNRGLRVLVLGCGVLCDLL